MPFKLEPKASFWPDLVNAFSQNEGACLFNVPEKTAGKTTRRILTAMPTKRAELSAASLKDPEGYGPLLTPFSPGICEAPATETEHWLPLTLGFVSYPDAPSRARAGTRDDRAAPAMLVARYDWAAVLDLEAETLTIHFHDECPASTRAQVTDVIKERERSARAPEPMPSGFQLTAPFTADQSRATYLARVERIKEYIRAGDIYQANYAQRFWAPFTGEPIHAFNALYDASPSPCSVYLDTGYGQILSLSPERFLRVNQGMVESTPIKGTRPRGRTQAEDDRLRHELITSPKDTAENLMIVDLLRNDLGKVCEIGSVTAEPLFAVESFANVHHLVSTIRGRLAAGYSPLDLLISAFPGGSITGAPKRRAMEVIDELEPSGRGPYCGSFFHWSPGHGFDSTIAIRTLYCQEGRIECWGGGGIVSDSVPEEEYAESITKIQLFMAILEARA